MSGSSTVEQRLEQVEKQLADLKSHVKNFRPAPNWIDAITGTFKDDPEFDEILRLGKEIRDADKPSEE
ncbi:MAG: hypothetical protein H8E44_09395 [Planctomycetes bacterium]|nr:hypothetical protein [Planctomycetota bacterium]MBL7041732.1 hypothetical protein [Pirellulaceae bacterium]